MFAKILIANRGEIACRIIRTAKRLGISTVAIYSQIDAHAQHVLLADEAYCVGAASAQSSYLNSAEIIEIARKTQAQAIHPGYGFLSENTDFAAACAKADIIFIGPPVAAIAAMGSKSAAKHIMQQANIPVIPGYHEDDQDPTHLLQAARKIGFPILIKAVAGGGGKGMRSVHDEQQFMENLQGAKREAKASFNDDRVLLEKLVLQPRHIEMQVFADNHGNAVYLFERDCSIQRRHQKVVEEAPANITTELRAQMGKTAVAAAQAIDYRGAGTIEFLVDQNQQFYFMEMNTRLQVEHPVTEMITGLDLVEWQLRVAANEPLPLAQDQLNIKGHAIEVRIYAEDPQQNFMPSIGTIEYLQTPSAQANVRIDSGIVTGDSVSIYYDPMLAKLITWGKDRAQAITVLQHALQHYQVLGIKTNINFLQNVVSHPAFMQHNITTDFIAAHQTELLSQATAVDHTPLLLACLYYLIQPPQSTDPWADHSAWQMNLPTEQRFEFEMHQQHFSILVVRHADHFEIIIEQQHYKLTGSLHDDKLTAYCNDQCIIATIQQQPQQLLVITASHVTIVALFDVIAHYLHEQQQHGQLTAPMPGTVVAVNVAKGQQIKTGDSLIVIEAMKMEHTIYAPNNGIIEDIHYQVGQQVNEGDELLVLHEL